MLSDDKELFASVCADAPLCDAWVRHMHGDWGTQSTGGFAGSVSYHASAITLAWLPISQNAPQERVFIDCALFLRGGDPFVNFLLLHHVQNLWSSQYKKSAPLWYYSKKLYFRHYKIPQRRRLLLGLRSEPTLLPLHWGRTTKTTTLGGASSGAPVKVLTRLEIGTLLGLEHISCECQS